MVAYSNNLTKSQRTGVNQNDLEYLANAKLQYQPSVVRNKVIAMFRFLKANCILYESHEFKAMPGSFNAYWKDKMAVTAKARTDYGNLPNQPCVQVSDNEHIWEKANPPFFPFVNYMDLMMLLTYFIGRNFQLRTCEVSFFCFISSIELCDHGAIPFLLAIFFSQFIAIQMSHVHFAKIEEGPLKGLGRVYISMGNDDKTVKLSLSNATLRGNLSGCDIVENPQDPHCTYYLLKFHIKNSFPPGFEGRIWRREAPKGVQNSKHGMPKQLTKADLAKNGVFGENYPTELIRRLGAPAQFNEEGRTLSFRSRARHKGATLVANCGASDKTKINAFQHTGVLMNARYQEELDALDQAKCQVASHYVPPKSSVLQEPNSLSEAPEPACMQGTKQIPLIDSQGTAQIAGPPPQVQVGYSSYLTMAPPQPPQMQYFAPPPQI
jgi:hypothetical protein